MNIVLSKHIARLLSLIVEKRNERSVAVTGEMVNRLIDHTGWSHSRLVRILLFYTTNYGNNNNNNNNISHIIYINILNTLVNDQFLNGRRYRVG